MNLKFHANAVQTNSKLSFPFLTLLCGINEWLEKDEIINLHCTMILYDSKPNLALWIQSLF